MLLQCRSWIRGGITINQSHVEYETEQRHYGHVDCWKLRAGRFSPLHLDFLRGYQLCIILYTSPVHFLCLVSANGGIFALMQGKVWVLRALMVSSFQGVSKSKNEHDIMTILADLQVSRIMYILAYETAPARGKPSSLFHFLSTKSASKGIAIILAVRVHSRTSFLMFSHKETL